MLGMSWIALEQPRLALPYLQRCTELNDQDGEAFFQYGLCLANEEYIDEAIIQFEKCIDLDPTHADAFYNLGVAYGFKEDGEKAIHMFDKALEIDPKHILAGHGKKLLDS
jgi:tetratricopeptide (TPR) repeat protein